MKLLIICSLLFTTSLFAETISQTNEYGSVSVGIATNANGIYASGTSKIDAYGSESGTRVYKKVIEAAQPDAIAILEGEEATPLFLEAKGLLEEKKDMTFESNLEAALAIVEENNK